MPEKTTQTLTQQKVKTTTKINLVIGMISAFFIGLAMFCNAFLYGPVGWNYSTFASTPDTIPPTALITSPVNYQTISGLFDITATLEDNTHVKKVEFYLDGKIRYTEHQPKSPWIFYWNTTKATNGNHVFMIKVYDNAGNETIVNPVAVTVNN